MAAAPYQRILLTGGAGFVGAYLAPMIARAWPQAQRVIACRPDQPGERAGWTSEPVDICDGGAVDALIARLKPDLVLHLAAQASVGAAAREGEQTWRVNVGGALELASACLRHDAGDVFFFASTSEVYGRSFAHGPVDETSALDPANVYARTKAAAEAMLGDVLGSTRRLIIARAFNHTGAGQDERFFLPSLAAQIARIEAGLQEPVVKVGNLDVRRDFLDVEDVCRAYLALVQAAARGDIGGVFNIASGDSYLLSDLVARLRARARTPFAIEVDPTRVRAAEIGCVSGEAAKLRAATGWRPQTPIDQTLDALLEHWRGVVARG